MASNSHRTSNEHSYVDILLKAVRDQTRLAEAMKSSYRIKMAQLEVKRKRTELQIKREQGEQERRRFAAEERTLVLQQQMREKEIVHNERMMPYELELARLKAGQRKVDG